MRIRDKRIFPYLGWSMLAGVISVVILAVVWGVISGGLMILFVIGLWIGTLIVPLACAVAWLIGGFIAWLVSKNEKQLPYATYIVSMIAAFGFYLYYADASIKKIHPFLVFQGVIDWLGCLKVEPMSLMIFIIYVSISSVTVLLIKKYAIPRVFVLENK